MSTASAGLRENGFRQLSVLHEAGIPTLMIGYRNDPWGPKGKRPFYSFGLDEWRDLEAAVQWARGRGAERIVLVAESMGAAIVGPVPDAVGGGGQGGGAGAGFAGARFPRGRESFARWVPFRQLILSLGYGMARAVLPVDLETAVVADVVRDFPGPVFVSARNRRSAGAGSGQPRSRGGAGGARRPMSRRARSTSAPGRRIASDIAASCFRSCVA